LAEAGSAVKLQSAHCTPIEVADIVLNIGAFFGSTIVAVLAIEKRGNPNVPKSALFGAAAAYLLYAALNYPRAWINPGAWSTKMNDWMTLLKICKTFADNVSSLFR